MEVQRSDASSIVSNFETEAMDECQESRNERDLLRDFISAYKDLPELWDVRNEAYTKKQIRDVAYKKLLVFYKKIKSNATVEDVKKKINSLRSNFRKELKKVALLKRSDAAIEGAHEPLRHSWLFEELQFLVDLEKSAEGDLINENTDVTTIYDCATTDYSSTKQYSTDFKPVAKKVKYSENSQQWDLLSHTCGYLSEQDESIHIAKMWAAKLRSLSPNQKLFAEKAINDVLFEAQLGTLHRNSVKINEPTSSSSLSPSHN